MNDNSRSTRLAERIAGTLARAVDNLFNSIDEQGHWKDVRSTAAATWALAHVIETRSLSSAEDVSLLRNVTRRAAKWIAGQAKKERSGMSWESEGWDSSFAMLALLSTGEPYEEIDAGATWLESIRCQRSGSWYDEVWETVLCLAALLRRDRLGEGPRSQMEEPLVRSLQWLNDIPSKSSGEFISPHYSGFLVWLDEEILRADLGPRFMRTSEYDAFRKKVGSSAEWLVKTALESSAELWCPFTFANSYIAFGLFYHRDHRRNAERAIEKVIDWLEWKQGKPNGSFEDIEDTALAVLALSTIHEHLGVGGKVLSAVLKQVRSRAQDSCTHCFIGYAGSSRGMFLELNEFLSKNIPGLRVVDWNWDLDLGVPIMSQIEEQGSRCQIAIFLLTRDEQIQRDATVAFSPRDNVVFEVGFFAGRIGLERTLLIVEEGTELPSDWGGIKLVQFRKRHELASVHTVLRRAIERLLVQP